MAASNSGVKQWATYSGQTLIGTGFADTLGGINGAVTLVGGSGNDTYYSYSALNAIQEEPGGGDDLVITSKNYILGANLENLQLTGDNTYGIGNALANVISGGAGHQQLYGAGGNDVLTGGAGSDTFIVRVGGGSDTITDFEAVAIGTDVIQLGSYGFTSFQSLSSHMSQVGNNVVIQLNAGETLTLNNHKLADFAASDFQYALDTTKLTQTFGDEFNSVSLQSAGGTWRTSFYDGASGRLHGDESQVYMDKDYLGLGVNPFSTTNGVLTIHAETASAAVKQATGEDYTSGMLSSRGTFSQTYGYFEIRAEMPSETGTWPAFWLLPANGSWPPELDVFETLGKDTSSAILTAHSNADGTHTMAGISSWVGDVSAGMHTYGVLWTKTDLVWYIDGEEVFRTATPADMNQPMYMVTNLAIGGAWGGDTDTNFTGADMQIDYIHAYQLQDQTGIPNVVTSDTFSLTLDAVANSLVLTGNLNLNGTGNSLNNILTGNTGNNVLDGGLGADRMIGGAGNDTYYVDNAGDTITEWSTGGIDSVYSSIDLKLADNVENLTLTGTSNLNATGNWLNNVLTGNAGNNVLDGSLGADTMIGGAGNDTYYVDNAGDAITEWSAGGIDSVYAFVSHTLENNVENLTLTGLANINATGNWLSNTLIGNAGNNTLDGGSGADTLIGGSGSDAYYVDNSGDIVTELAGGGTDTVYSSISYALGANVENLTLTAVWNTNGTGNSLNNILTGNTGNNVLDGGLGADRMIGGAGNDTYYVDNAGDTITEWSTGGIDSVYSSIDLKLADNVENLTLTGTSNLNATGNWLNNVLTGNAGNNVLDGSLGADTMIGGAGNDTYYVDNAGDAITEWSAGGIDSVYASVSHTLENNVENLTLTGLANINATGNWLSNTLIGNAGNNILDGGSGADTLIGGSGSDAYYVDNSGDIVTELAGGGTDTVYSSISYALGANVENLTLTAVWNTNGTGNELNNTLTGNTGNNVLDGGLGADRMIGGAGNDTYYVDNAGDVVTELAGGGNDTVYSSRAYTLGDDVENLTLTGTGNLTATGNTLANILNGNDGDNILNGGTGGDTMIGGAGNDTYYVDNAADTITEWSTGGIDTIYASVSHTLENNVENLTLTGVGAINAIGNGINNLLTGNAGNNELSGGGGRDVLVGGLGADVLTGGAGNDTFKYNSALESTANNRDTITDFSRGDIIDFSSITDHKLSFIYTNDFSGTAGEVQVTASGTGSMVSIDINGDHTADTQIYLSNISVTSLHADGSDFLL